MEMQTILNILLCGILTVAGWFVRQMWDAVQNLKKDIQRIEIDLPSNYVKKMDLESRLDKIDAMLDKLFEKLDNKVDK
jgi:hypothetical protein